LGDLLISCQGASRLNIFTVWMVMAISLKDLEDPYEDGDECDIDQEIFDLNKLQSGVV
jgi:hypothetical protein